MDRQEFSGERRGREEGTAALGTRRTVQGKGKIMSSKCIHILSHKLYTLNIYN